MLLYQTMSHDERLHEAVADFREIYEDKLGKLLDRNHRLFAVTKKFPVKVTCPLKSARGNQWKVTLLARSKQEAKHPGYMPLLKYHTSHGVGFLYPKLLDEWTMDVIVYDFTPHLVSRYKERFLQAQEDSEQLLENFMVDMMMRNMPLHVAYDEKRKCYASFVEDGIFLSDQCDPHRYVMWKTFVTEEMLFDDQAEAFELVSSFRERYLAQAARTGQYAKGCVHLGDDGLPLMFGKHERNWG
jgi:hypothetical protein